ncbi:MAG: hypothetical protein IFK94_08415 [Acidobacteria bacterium]|uniref:Two component regulator three Y domain-containing protein n=1 Tax=Candidatus Polarisedimenticola svalbardensis TaxID=2886004 RepID=A0A8J6Y6J0_9BACT|nr:hypothetical protein [Candidatus Polarisedimenticola svalbardensis]
MENARFNRLTLEDGLSQSSVNCIVQDNQGFLWFGTQDGLNRYDGYEFKTFHHDDRDPGSISNNFVWALHVDRNGLLWIGTEGGGLSLLLPGFPQSPLGQDRDGDDQPDEQDERTEGVHQDDHADGHDHARQGRYAVPGTEPEPDREQILFRFHRYGKGCQDRVDQKVHGGGGYQGYRVTGSLTDRVTDQPDISQSCKGSGQRYHSQVERGPDGERPSPGPEHRSDYADQGDQRRRQRVQHDQGGEDEQVESGHLDLQGAYPHRAHPQGRVDSNCTTDQNGCCQKQDPGRAPDIIISSHDRSGVRVRLFATRCIARGMPAFPTKRTATDI